MITAKYVLLGVLALALFAIPGAVAAGVQGSGQVSVSAIIPTTCEITVTPASLDFGSMEPGHDYYTATGAVNVACNYAPWTVTAADDATGGKPAGYLWSGSAAMSQAFQLYNGVGWAALTTPEAFAQGTTTGSFTFPDQFYQQVTGADSAGTYTTAVTFTLSV